MSSYKLQVPKNKKGCNMDVNDCSDIVNKAIKNATGKDCPAWELEGDQNAIKNYKAASKVITNLKWKDDNGDNNLTTQEEIKQKCIVWGTSAMNGCDDGKCVPLGLTANVTKCPTKPNPNN